MNRAKVNHQEQVGMAPLRQYQQGQLISCVRAAP